MKKISLSLLITAAVLFGSANEWRRIQDGSMGGRNYPSFQYAADSNRFFLTLGVQTDYAVGQPYCDQMFSFSSGRWVNQLPAAELYGVWADSTGPARGLGQAGATTFGVPYFIFKGIAYNGTSYLRPNLIHAASMTYNQSAYNPDDGKIYYYVLNRTFTYDTRSRRWDTLSPATHPAAAVSVTSELWWGAMCYDPVNKEILLFGGGNINADRGHCGTWAFRPSDTTWRKLDLPVQPRPRAQSPMAYEPVNRCIVLFGGDHLDYMMSDTWVYRCATRTWERLSPAENPPARCGHALFYLPKSGKIALLGGFEPSSACSTYTVCSPYKGRPTLELWVLDVAAAEWKLVKSFASGATTPLFKAYRPVLAAADTGDRILLVADSTLSVTSYHQVTWALDCDPSQYDAAGTQSIGVAPNTDAWRGGVWDPSYFITGLSAPDTAANETFLRNLPMDTWTRITPPRIPRGNRDWGTAVYDPVNDLVMKWSGGHSAYCGSEVPVYSPSRHRWTIGFVPEYPLECNGANTRYPNAPTFNNRPFMIGHTYDNMCFDVNLKKMLFMRNHMTYLFDAARQDWDSVFIPTHPATTGFPQRVTLCTTPYGAMAMGQGSGRLPYGLFIMDSATRTWKQLVNKGLPFPPYYEDHGGIVYDSKRNRLLITCFDNEPGQIWCWSFSDSTLVKLNPENPGGIALASSDYIREFLYMPYQDQLFCQTQKNGGHLVYDCASNEWRTKAVSLSAGVAAAPSSVSSGYVYDEKRDLVWDPESGLRDFYVIRLSGGRLAGEGGRLATGIIRTGIAAFPNPFSSAVTIRCTLAREGRVSVRVMDASGRLVVRLADGMRPAGTLKAGWKGEDSQGRKVPAGIYILKAELGRETFNLKLIVVK